MSRKEKLIKRLLTRPKDFTYDELTVILDAFGYFEIKTGKTGGSRRAFFNKTTQHIIRLHKPHPQNILKCYQIDQIIEELTQKGLL